MLPGISLPAGQEVTSEECVVPRAESLSGNDWCVFSLQPNNCARSLLTLPLSNLCISHSITAGLCGDKHGNTWLCVCERNSLALMGVHVCVVYIQPSQQT